MKRSNPDIQYQQLRQNVLQYEDNATANVISGVPNYYITRNDQTRFGEMLHSVAKEMARLEYDYTYDMMGKSPRFLTPPDARRIYSKILGIPNNYPLSSQSDLEYLSMVVDLIAAFNSGTTVQALQDVITAYIGNSLQVVELFTKIGGGLYDQSDRNTIAISAVVGGDSSLQNLNEIQILTQNLYPALNLAKPAHVGIKLSAIFTEDEALDNYTSGISTDTFSGVTDDYKIIMMLTEAPPDPNFYLAPDLSSTPISNLAPTALNFTLAPITLSGLASQTGCSWSSPLNKGDIVKVGYQTDISQNGYYTASTGVWSKYKPAQGNLSPNMDTVWEVTDSDPIILDLD
jgi:hypothetical protein